MSVVTSGIDDTMDGVALGTCVDREGLRDKFKTVLAGTCSLSRLIHSLVFRS